MINKQKADIKYQKEQIQHYEKKLEVTQGKLSMLKSKLDRVNHRVAYWRTKLDDLQAKLSMKQANCHSKIESLKQEIYSLDLQNDELRQTLDSELGLEINTFENGKYNDDVRACAYELLSLNVGVHNIAPVILCVLKTLHINLLPAFQNIL